MVPQKNLGELRCPHYMVIAHLLAAWQPGHQVDNVGDPIASKSATSKIIDEDAKCQVACAKNSRNLPESKNCISKMVYNAKSD